MVSGSGRRAWIFPSKKSVSILSIDQPMAEIVVAGYHIDGVAAGILRDEIVRYGLMMRATYCSGVWRTATSPKRWNRDGALAAILNQPRNRDGRLQG